MILGRFLILQSFRKVCAHLQAFLKVSALPLHFVTAWSPRQGEVSSLYRHSSHIFLSLSLSSTRGSTSILCRQLTGTMYESPTGRCAQYMLIFAQHSASWLATHLTKIHWLASCAWLFTACWYLWSFSLVCQKFQSFRHAGYVTWPSCHPHKQLVHSYILTGGLSCCNSSN